MITYKMTSGINLNNRNAFDFINILHNFDGAMYIEKTSERRQANAKSLLGLLSLNIKCEDEIVIITNISIPEKVLNQIKIAIGNK